MCQSLWQQSRAAPSFSPCLACTGCPAREFTSALAARHHAPATIVTAHTHTATLPRPHKHTCRPTDTPRARIHAHVEPGDLTSSAPSYQAPRNTRPHSQTPASVPHPPPRPTHKHQAPPPSPHPHAPANTSSTTKPRIAHAKVKHVMSCAVGKCMHIPPSHPHPTPSRRQHLRTACTLVLSLGIWGLQPATWCSATFLHRRPKITPSSTCIHHLSLAVVQAHDCTLRSTKETISIALCTLFGLLRLQQAS